jgi:hypothetical protein
VLRNGFTGIQIVLEYVKDISGDLGSKNGKIIGADHENDSQGQAIPIFPEVFVKYF